ncbi:hypothetical protein [Acidovorax delafieldii]|jgi:hypothetical protein|uniref:hypothetical protein n=1 Tax=Acidovorax delafieldii TaxID=47920 RepID=UPI0037573E75
MYRWRAWTQMAKDPSSAGWAPPETRSSQKHQKTIAVSQGQLSASGQKHQDYSQQPANDTLEARYWQALNFKGTVQNTGTDGLSGNAKLCEVYYFHADQVGLHEELSSARSQIIRQRVLAGPPLLLRSTTKQAGETRCSKYPNH